MRGRASRAVEDRKKTINVMLSVVPIEPTQTHEIPECLLLSDGRNTELKNPSLNIVEYVQFIQVH